MKIVKIPYKGEQVDVELNEDISFGDLDDIISKNVHTDRIMQGDIKIDLVNYRYQLAMAVISKAPWPVKNLKALKDLPLVTGRAVVKEAANMFPLKDSLMDLASTFTGQMTPEQKEAMKKAMNDLLS